MDSLEELEVAQMGLVAMEGKNQGDLLPFVAILIVEFELSW